MDSGSEINSDITRNTGLALTVILFLSLTFSAFNNTNQTLGRTTTTSIPPRSGRPSSLSIQNPDNITDDNIEISSIDSSIITQTWSEEQIIAANNQLLYILNNYDFSKESALGLEIIFGDICKNLYQQGQYFYILIFIRELRENYLDIYNDHPWLQVIEYAALDATGGVLTDERREEVLTRLFDPNVFQTVQDVIGAGDLRNLVDR